MTSARKPSPPPSARQELPDGGDTGGGNQDVGTDTSAPEPKYLSGCDLFLQISERMLDAFLYLSTEPSKVAHRGEEDYWDVVQPGDEPGEVTKIRYLTTPSAFIGDENVTILFPDCYVEATNRFGLCTCRCSVTVKATMGVEFAPLKPTTGDGALPPEYDPDETPPPTVNQTYKMFFRLTGTQQPELVDSTLLINGEPPDREAVREGAKSKIERERDFDQALPGDGIRFPQLGLPAESANYEVLTFAGKLILVGRRDTNLPGREKVYPFDTKNDFIAGLSADLANPLMMSKLNSSISGQSVRKINNNYDFYVNSLSVRLVQDGFNFYDGSAVCRGHTDPEKWYDLIDWYPDVHAQILALNVSFDGVNEPDGNFVFKFGKPSLDVDNWDLVKFLLWGLVTHGTGLGGSPLWWFFNPIIGLVAALADFFPAKSTGTSSKLYEVKGIEKGGVSVQFVNMTVVEAALALYGNSAAVYPDTAKILGSQVLWVKGEPRPAGADTDDPPEQATYTLSYDDIWYEDPRYWLVWKLNGRTLKEGVCAETLSVEVGPLAWHDFRGPNHAATLAAELYRVNGYEEKEYVYRKSLYVRGAGEWGMVEDYYIYNEFAAKQTSPFYHARMKLHYAVPEKRCRGISAAHALGHKFWGLPPAEKDQFFTTCRDCFGYIRSVQTDRPALEAERAAWLKP